MYLKMKNRGTSALDNDWVKVIKKLLLEIGKKVENQLKWTIMNRNKCTFTSQTSAQNKLSSGTG